MPSARRVVLVLFLFLPAIYLAAQTSANEPVFTITVASPTSVKDVQLRYFVADSAGVRWTSSASQAVDNKIEILANAGAGTAKTLKAIVYAPGCQFVTFSVDDLTTSTRQGDFQCQPQSTVQLHGRTAVPSTDRQLRVQAMYVVRWAGQFFSHGISLSPLKLTSARVENDGSFALDVPDFSSDPLWSSLSHDATLMFLLVDAETGHPVATLKAPAALSRGGDLKVAANYPEVAFTIRATNTAKATATNISQQ